MKSTIALIVIFFLGYSIKAQDEIVNGSLTVKGALITSKNGTGDVEQLKIGYGVSAMNYIGFYEGTALRGDIQYASNENRMQMFNDETGYFIGVGNGGDGLVYGTNSQQHKVFHEGNSNNNSIDWMCRNLDVNGFVKAHQIEVTLASMESLHLSGNLAAKNITYKVNGQTADFVFEEDYNLRSLNEIETFIKTNKHLPDIPSAKEMEESGVNLAEMNKLLLQKVEELTLYAIQQKAEAENVRRTESEARKALEARLVKLEEMLLKE